MKPQTSVSPRLHDVVAAVERRAAAGALNAAGGVSPSAALQHCAQSIHYSVAGYPQLKPAVFRATVGRLAKRHFLRVGRISHDLSPTLPGAPTPDPDLPVAEAVAGLRDAVAEFERANPPLAPHLAYGSCVKTDYERLHVMHIVEHFPDLTADR